MQRLDEFFTWLISSFAEAETNFLQVELAILAAAILISAVSRHGPAVVVTVTVGAMSMALTLAPAASLMVVSLAGTFGALMVAIAGFFARRRQLRTERRLQEIEARLVQARADLECLFLRHSRVARQGRKYVVGGAIDATSRTRLNSAESLRISSQV